MKRWIIVLSFFIVLLSLTHTQSYASAFQADACAKAPAARLKSGGQAKVIASTLKDIPGAVLKANPDHTSPVLRYLPVGTVVAVGEGPQCGKDGSRWWNVSLGALSGLMAESNGKAYALEPFTGTAPDPLSTTMAEAMICIGKPGNATPEAIGGAQPAATEAATGASSDAAAPPAATEAAAAPDANQGPATLRVLYATLDGDVMVSDNGEIGRSIAKFTPAPLSVDLSPDGTAAMVGTFNGLYWIDVATGNTLLVADSTKFALGEGGWIDAVKWLPAGSSAAVEITERANGIVTYAVWNVPLDGSFPPYRVDSGAQPYGGLVRSPNFKRVVLLGVNEISDFPRAATDTSRPLLDYVPRIPEGENTLPVVPILAWDADEKGFFTYIPVSDEAPPDDTIGGHLWYVAMDGSGLDLGKTPKLAVTDYVIASGDGKAILVFHSGAWTIRDAKTGATVQTIPPSQAVFGWTPDNKGVLYRDTTGTAKYLGIDGGTDSPFAPNLTNLYDIKWLPDGSSLYVARGKDNKLSFSVKQPGKDAAFLGIVSTVDTYKARILYGKIAAAVAPEKCK